jgi:dTMP kinase
MCLFVAIEGIDGSGKGTQAALLQSRLTSDGDAVDVVSFPRYGQTRFGRAVGNYLNGEFGALETVHPLLASLLFSGDRFESKALIDEALRENDVLICDRYVASNVAHQCARLEGDERQSLRSWIEQTEYEVYGLPRADLTVLFDLPASAAQELVAGKPPRDYTSHIADIHEADQQYLERVRETYCELARHDGSWCRIDLVASGRLRPVDEIARDVYEVVTRKLNAT